MRLFICPNQSKPRNISFTPSPSPDVAGYRLYCSDAADIVSGNIDTYDLGTALSVDLVIAHRICCKQWYAVKAYSASGAESVLSNIVEFPLAAPPAVTITLGR